MSNVRFHMQPSQSALAQLKAIRRERSSRSPFKDHTAFLSWADQAEPLLAFNAGIAQEFSGNVHAAKMLLGWKEGKYDGAVSEAIGTVNKAITLLEGQAVPVPESPVVAAVAAPLAAPEKVTISWLMNHVPVLLFVGGAALLVSSFGLGLAFSETQLYALLKSRAASASTTTTSKAAYPIESQPSKLPHIASSPK